MVRIDINRLAAPSAHPDAAELFGPDMALEGLRIARSTTHWLLSHDTRTIRSLFRVHALVYALWEEGKTIRVGIVQGEEESLEGVTDCRMMVVEVRDAPEFRRLRALCDDTQSSSDTT